MTAFDPSEPIAVQSDSLEAKSVHTWWKWLDLTIERLGELLNPILVKESRQALKSKQFLITFSLLLICGWGWSIGGIAMQWPGVYYAPGGSGMLLGYYFVLALPLLVVVPFSAFRSLASEREDGTYELLSITALSSRQVVTGKLGSAVLQMLVYYSALSPCVAFTYLLRGVDIVTIALVLSYTFMMSLMMATLGLLLATITRSKHWQALLSVVLIIALLIALWIWSAMIVQILYALMPYDEPMFWISNLCLLMFYVSFLVLFISAAAARLSFASDNRSTRLRVIMLAQQVLLVGWFMYLWVVSQEDEALPFFLSFAGVYWFLCGTLMTGESAELSPRTKRRLPRSVLGRVLLTWFNPGSGTGYVFAIANLLSMLTLVVIAQGIAKAVAFNGALSDWDDLYYPLLVFCYVTIYLGVGRLIILLIRRFFQVGLFIAFLIQMILIGAGATFPPVLNMLLVGVNNMDYSLLQITNWVWTLNEVADSSSFPDAPLVIFGLVLAAGIVFLFNLILAAREIEQVRQQTPERVIQDDIQRNPHPSPAESTAKSPWDSEADGG